LRLHGEPARWLGHPVILTGSIGNNYQARGDACIRASESRPL
jgi:hypothetical protein